MKTRRPAAAYTLIEVLVALGIIALAIGAASQLSLSQSLTEDLNQKETMAVNFGENHARLWQLGVTPSAFLLPCRNSNNSLMTCTIGTPANVNGGEDNGSHPVQVDRAVFAVNWQPAGKSDPTVISLNALRMKPDRR